MQLAICLDQDDPVFSGIDLDDWDMWPLDFVRVTGSGMRDLPTPDTHAVEPPRPDRRSRTAGTLGGSDVLERLASLHSCVVAAGRTGSVVASTDQTAA